MARPTTGHRDRRRRGRDGRVVRERKVTRPATAARARAPRSPTRVDVALALEHRQRGLLWYDTYERRVPRALHLPEPRRGAAAARRGVHVSQRPRPSTTTSCFLVERARPTAGRRATSRRACRPALSSRARGAPSSRWATGRAAWARGSTRFGDEDVAQVRDFMLSMTTNFERHRLPGGHDVAHREASDAATDGP